MTKQILETIEFISPTVLAETHIVLTVTAVLLETIVMRFLSQVLMLDKDLVQEVDLKSKRLGKLLNFVRFIFACRRASSCIFY